MKSEMAVAASRCAQRTCNIHKVPTDKSLNFVTQRPISAGEAIYHFRKFSDSSIVKHQDLRIYLEKMIKPKYLSQGAVASNGAVIRLIGLLVTNM